MRRHSAIRQRLAVKFAGACGLEAESRLVALHVKREVRDFQHINGKVALSVHQHPPHERIANNIFDGDHPEINNTNTATDGAIGDRDQQGLV